VGLLGHDLLELAVLAFEFTQPVQLVQLEPSILVRPPVVGRGGHAVLAQDGVRTQPRAGHGSAVGVGTEQVSQEFLI
jgi:hypothetical protein